MESKKINQLATELTPALDDLTIIGDPTTGVSKKITLSQMASLFTGTVEEYANLAAFPLVGVADTIYIALDTNVLYRWNTGTSAYVELSPNIINSLVFSDANGFDGTISLVGSVATLTITTALTQGSVPFIGTSGALTQDNANLFFDDTNNRLGINTNAPTTALDVFGSGIIGRLNGTSTNNSFLGFASAGTNKWSIGNVQSDHRFRIYNEATTSELVSILSTGEFGIGIANPTTKLHIDGGASALIANLDANVSVAKSISFRSDNSNRINLEVSGTESGSNAGANFFIRRYSDAGALIDTPLTITRSTGAISLAGALSGTSATFSSTLTTSLTNGSVLIRDNGTAQIEVNVRHSSIRNGVLSFTENGVADRWAIGTKPSDGTLYFSSAFDLSAPKFTLASTGAATFSSSITMAYGGTPRLILQDTDAGAGNVGILFKESTNDKWTLASVGGAFQFFNEATSSNALWISATNNIGIGTTTPTNGKLEVQTGATTAALWVQTGGTTSSYTIADFRTGSNAPALQLLGSGTAYFGGFVGMGMNTPGDRLVVNGNIGITDGVFQSGESYSLYLGDKNAFINSTFGQKVKFGAYNGFDFGFGSNSDLTLSTIWLTITGDGDLSMAQARSISINLDSTPFGGSSKYWRINNNAANGTFRIQQITNGGGMYLDPNNPSGGWIGISDMRLKNDLGFIEEGALSKIMNLKPRRFTFKTQNENALPSVGFFAQEIMQYLPETITEIKEEDGEFLTYNANFVIPYLVKAIQELHKKIELK